MELPILWKSEAATSAEYEEARCRIFNARKPNHYPRAIVKATTIAHIVAAVKLAVDQNACIAVRSGGHGLFGWTMRDDAILIDLQNFRHLSYDEEEQQAQASPSTTGGELLEFLEERKRFFPAGHSGDIGLGGFLLQAGIGLNCRGYGYSCESVAGVDVVTAEGEVAHCDEHENADLYWAARGAGSEFPAIVTRFYLNTRPLQPILMECQYIWPTAMYDDVFSWFDKLVGSLHEDVEPTLCGLIVPQLNVPGVMLSVSALGTTEDEAREKLAPIVSTRPPGTMTAQDFQVTSYTKIYEMGKIVTPPNHRYFTNSVFLKPGTDIVSACRNVFTTVKFPRDLAYWQPLRISPTRNIPDMAMSIHSENYVSLIAIWENQDEDASHMEWVDDGIKSLEPSIHGTFVADARPEKQKSDYWSEEAEGRLKAVWEKWDPQCRIRGIIKSL